MNKTWTETLIETYPEVEETGIDLNAMNRAARADFYFLLQQAVGDLAFSLTKVNDEVYREDMSNEEYWLVKAADNAYTVLLDLTAGLVEAAGGHDE